MTDKPKFYALSDEEWFGIRCARGSKMAQLPVHGSFGELVYYWPWGEQPNDVARYVISDLDPIKAAQKFLARYQPGTTDWATPKPKRFA